jgi:hypothetical protein
MSFTTGSPPAPLTAAILLSPTGSIGAVASPLFEWEVVTNATDYRFLLRNDTTGTVVIDQMYNLLDAGCGAARCSLPIAPTTLSDGNYRWLIRSKNGALWGPNSPMKSFIVTGVP